MTDRPKIVALCGSTWFMEAFYDSNMRETLAGHIVLTVGMSSYGDYHPTEEQKVRLDELHLRKIDLADEVLVLNCRTAVCSGCGQRCDTLPFEVFPLRSRCCRQPAPERPYVGSSTRREIAYAESLGKPIRYLEPIDG
jgi:hypothetical protein